MFFSRFPCMQQEYQSFGKRQNKEKRTVVEKFLKEFFDDKKAKTLLFLVSSAKSLQRALLQSFS